jgi:hypothetical protein
MPKFGNIFYCKAVEQQALIHGRRENLEGNRKMSKITNKHLLGLRLLFMGINPILLT